MPAVLSRRELLDVLLGWRGAAPSIRPGLLQAICSGISLRSLITNSVTLLLVGSLIITETGDSAHVAWFLLVILGGLMPRGYSAWLRHEGRFDRDTDAKALTFVAISGLYGLIWALGPFLLLPEITGTALGILLIIMVFGTVMGPYAPMPGILYMRLATTGLPTLVAVALYTTPRLTFVCVVLAVWLALQTDVWRGYHRTLRRQLELREALEARQGELQRANLAKERAMEGLKLMAETDPLTGAANRRQLLAHLEALRGPAAVVLFDIDRFKPANDTFGHHAGDAILVELAHLVQEVMRKKDLLARLGGDEFAIVLPDVSPDYAWVIAERVREYVAGHAVQVGATAVRVTISVGIGIVPPDVSVVDPFALLRDADAALYAAKRQGRNRTVAEALPNEAVETAS